MILPRGPFLPFRRRVAHNEGMRRGCFNESTGEQRRNRPQCAFVLDLCGNQNQQIHLRIAIPPFRRAVSFAPVKSVGKPPRVLGNSAAIRERGTETQHVSVPRRVLWAFQDHRQIDVAQELPWKLELDAAHQFAVDVTFYVNRRYAARHRLQSPHRL